MKIGIIGMGWVGSSVAISTLHTGVATELLVHDLNAGLAEGEAMDLAHGASFYPTAQVRSASIHEMSGADAVVVAPEMSADEKASLERSVGVLTQSAAQLDI
jgi:L-lactate dehydrogenase